MLPLKCSPQIPRPGAATGRLDKKRHFDVLHSDLHTYSVPLINLVINYKSQKSIPFHKSQGAP